jgi:hypothetical protein
MSCGLLCDPKHPALAQFPTDFHANWQWWELLSPVTRAAVLNSTPAAFRPIVQIVDQPARNNKEGVIFEARIGAGKLLVCTLDISSDLNRRIVARQLRHSLLTYMASASFKPSQELPIETLNSILDVPPGKG